MKIVFSIQMDELQLLSSWMVLHSFHRKKDCECDVEYQVWHKGHVSNNKWLMSHTLLLFIGVVFTVRYHWFQQANVNEKKNLNSWVLGPLLLKHYPFSYLMSKLNYLPFPCFHFLKIPLIIGVYTFNHHAQFLQYTQKTILYYVLSTSLNDSLPVLITLIWLGWTWRISKSSPMGSWSLLPIFW